MTNYSAKNVEEFIAAAPRAATPHLEELKRVVKSAVPEAEEGIHYGKPYYKYHGKYLAGFDTYKNHIGVELWTNKLDGDDRKALEEKGYATGSRTFQIRYDQQVPVVLLKKMLKARVAAIDA